MATRSCVARFDAGSFRRDPVTGDLHATANTTRWGVFDYRNPDGSTRRELRPKDEVLRADSLSMLNWKPLTDGHPRKGGKQILLDQQTSDEFRGGTVSNHRADADGTWAVADVVVTDKRLAKKIDSGTRGLSCGYECDEDWTPGVDPDHGPYDLIQRNIRYNHLAVVDRPRAGPGASFRADDAEPCARFDAEEIDPDDPEPITQTKTDSHEQEIQPMASIRIDEEDFEIPKELEKPLTRKFKADAAALSEAESKAKAEATRADKAEGELQAAKARLDSYEQAEQQQARVALQEQAGKVLKGAKFDGLSDRQIKEQVITAKLAIAKFDGYNDAHIEGMYTAALAVKPAGNAVMDAYDAAGSKTRTDEEDPIAAAYQKQIAAMTGATKE